MSRDNEVYTKAVRRKLDALAEKLHAAENRVRDINRQIEELIVGQSVIQPGARVVWVSGARDRYGRVLSVRSVYRGFEYRVAVLTKSGREIGTATLNESHQPELAPNG
jgi:hypothetical protein